MKTKTQTRPKAKIGPEARIEKNTRAQEIVDEIEALDAKLELLMAEDRTEYAQGIIDKMFSEFKMGAKWTRLMKDFAETKFYVYSPIGRKRNLPAALTEDRAIVAKQVRRGSNAPIQGFASEVGVKASRRMLETYYKELPYLRKILGIKWSIWDLRIPFNRIVHDASYFSVPYAMVLPFVHILQWEATYGITKAYKDEFDVDFTIEPEIEVEFSARDDKSHKWDWSISAAPGTPLDKDSSIVACITKAVNDASELGVLSDGRTVDEVIREIFKPWDNIELRTYLQTKFPLLNVKDLDPQIVAAIRPLFKKKE